MPLYVIGGGSARIFHPAGTPLGVHWLCIQGLAVEDDTFTRNASLVVPIGGVKYQDELFGGCNLGLILCLGPPQNARKDIDIKVLVLEGRALQRRGLGYKLRVVACPKPAGWHRIALRELPKEPITKQNPEFRSPYGLRLTYN